MVRATRSVPQGPGALPFVAAAIAAATLLGACGAPTPDTTAPSAASATPAPSVAASLTPTAPPAVTKRFTIAPDAIVDTKLLGTNDLYVNPGAVIEVDGVLHMFPNSFSKWPGRMRVPHLTSTDGLEWTLDTKAEILDTETDGLFPMANPGVDVSTGFVTDDGTWVLLFENVSLVTGGPWRIFRMTAPSPRGPWTVDPKPVIDVGSGDDFDTTGAQWPSVVRVGDRWAAYYAGVSGTGRGTGVIGVAFSEDGVTWTKQPEPVLEATESWELHSIDRPRVVATPDGYVMLYTALDLNRRGLATSTDGRTWTKVPGPSIEQKDFPLQGGSWDSALRYHDGELEYFLEIGNQTTAVYHATLAWP
jgi:beta-1,4-mannooligosaccharide phosphorylase